MTFIDRLAARVTTTRTPLVVGLDPRWQSLPDGLRLDGDDQFARAAAYQRFCCDIIDVVAPLVPAVKPQVAFFEELGWPGMRALDAVVQHARAARLLVVIDAKRGDIGSTAEGYAAAWLDPANTWHGDALTVSPYLGADTLEPFVQACDQHGSGLFVLVKTSNPGSNTLQNLVAEDRPNYQHVAAWVEGLSGSRAGKSGYGSIGAVAGATYPRELAELRELMPHVWFLVPGFGSQGGTADDVAPAFDSRGLGALVNSSRGIIFAHARKEYAHLGSNQWQTAVEAATREANAQLAAAARLTA